MNHASSLALVTAVLLAGEGGAAAEEREERESAFLGRFEGGWSGQGQVRLAKGAPMVSVQCSLAGTAEGQKLDLKGQCGGGLLRTSVHASLRYDESRRSFVGVWRAGSSNAGLSGGRSGNGISLAVDAPSEPDRRLTLSVNDRQLRFTMTRKDDSAQVLALALNKN